MDNKENINFDSGDEELNAKILKWFEWDECDVTIKEIQDLAVLKEWDELRKRLCTRMSFGTAGLRGRMQAGFSAMNELVIIQTAQGLCQYIMQSFPDSNDRSRGIALGYDGRYNSKRFAERTACVFINEGIPVYLFSRMIATPFIPFTIKEKNCLAGIMVTASHNPKQDNGYKVYWSNGAQIISPHDKAIQKMILDNLCPLELSWNTCGLTTSLLRDPYPEICDLYFRKLHQNIPQKFLHCNHNSIDVRFVYTAMHGVGYPFVETAFEVAGLQPLAAVMQQRDADPEFPTVIFPNPEEGKASLVLSIELANASGVPIILANDPDADRLACAERNEETGEWKVFTGNELGALLGWWALHYYKEENPDATLSDVYLLGSTVSSKILQSMAKIDGFNFEETLTGFKWMGNRTVKLLKDKKKVLFAFEEAIGFMFSPTVLDKDGISAACHLATMVCYLKKHENRTLLQKLNSLYDTYGYHCTRTSYYICHDPDLIRSIFERIRHFEDDKVQCYPSSIIKGKYKIASIRDLTTGIDTAESSRIAKLPSSSSSQMITFRFENGVVITLRTSGTEPKIKYYAEMCAQPEEKDWSVLRITLKEMIEAVVEDFLQPIRNKLIPQSSN